MAWLTYRTAEGQTFDAIVQDVIVRGGHGDSGGGARVLVTGCGSPEAPVEVHSCFERSHACHVTRLEYAVVRKAEHCVIDETTDVRVPGGRAPRWRWRRRQEVD